MEMDSILNGCNPEIILFITSTHGASSDEIHRIANKMWGFENNFSLKEKHSYIYVMRDNITGLHKIGRTTNVGYRESTLQSQCPSIELLFSKQANKSVETKLHKQYASKRIRGEWFNLTMSDLNDIIECLKRWGNNNCHR